MRKDAADGRPCHRAAWHTNYVQATAVIGRLASTDPNLQNIPVRIIEGRRIREAFIAPAGCVIVSADYSQIELRIMAHISRDENLLRAFAAGEDVHRASAAEIFNRGLRDVLLPELPSWSVAARADQAFRWTRARDVMPGYRFGVRDVLSLRRCFGTEAERIAGFGFEAPDLV